MYLLNKWFYNMWLSKTKRLIMLCVCCPFFCRSYPVHCSCTLPPPMIKNATVIGRQFFYIAVPTRDQKPRARNRLAATGTLASCGASIKACLRFVQPRPARQTPIYSCGYVRTLLIGRHPLVHHPRYIIRYHRGQKRATLYISECSD